MNENEQFSLLTRILFYLASDDTDSGLGSCTTLSTEQKKHRSSIKGLINLGNTCFFNVVVQVRGFFLFD